MLKPKNKTQMLARTTSTLAAASERISKEYSVETRIFPADLSNTSSALRYEIAARLREHDVSLVVNNAGYARRLPGEFHKTPLSDLHRTVEVNCKSVALVSHTALAHFMHRAQTLGVPSRRCCRPKAKIGGLVVMSSITATSGSPGMSGYAASKAFDKQLAHSLNIEYSNKGVDVLCVKPAYVATRLSGATRTGGFPPVISARACARGSLDCLGHDTETYGHWQHDVQAALMRMVPKFLMRDEVREEMQRFTARKREFLATQSHELREDNKITSVSIDGDEKRRNSGASDGETGSLL
uniref:Protochlorophyllide reductase n=1 Tax=Lotharella globosa TaxID=91324 RepID=A0A6V3JPZ1_9EUKA|mmetsp:Transcript_6835/g.12687  ORF Transcript_6835/g.12687 Transcript_6835/m.12687 type:complete len:297 (+) Transcript_6835:342-1232(+)